MIVYVYTPCVSVEIQVYKLTSRIWKFLLTPLANIVSTKELGTVVLSLTRNELRDISSAL